ncbi:eCIS core domain-containing protein [Deinococcus sp. UR1]|uniref:eCIS core domain-containing protein n=1 Tax=Deinococcus sp. UR1 TaxID=1704277 RepID=UPI000C6BDF8B|nr:DUF4157 domain-containing protein [Deinococcus sp. UR1]PIG99014.1 hypothetical protein AMD26_006305 [Deinococcus sp. UR1]
MAEFQHRSRTPDRRAAHRTGLSPAPDATEPTLQRLAAPLQRFLDTPTRAQAQATQPVLRAATLQRQEEDRLASARAQAQQRAAALRETGLVQRPVQPPVPAKPVSPSDWVTVMRARAERVDGQRLDTRTFGEFQTLQRQVAQSLSQGFRSDRGEPAVRYATYGEHLATLQRHALSAPVSRVVLGLVPPSERLPLQRATDEALQRQLAQEQAARDFESLQTLQRQLAELDAVATQPVLQRIQARRGAGNPLPEAIQRHLEQGLNHDLSRVRIHDDAEADKLAKGVNALAFTTGTDIFFQAGRFDPNTRGGLELLAHEVTHTVQQSQGRVGRGIDPDAGLEAEARTMGAKLAQSGPQFGTKHTPRPRAALLNPTAPAAPTVQRWANPLDRLRKLKEKAKTAVRQVIRTVREPAARKAALNAIKRAVPAPIRRSVQTAIQKGKTRVKAASSRVTQVVRRAPQVQKLLKVANGLPARARTAITAAATRVRQAAQTLGTASGRAHLAQRARAAAQQTLQAAARRLPPRAQTTLRQIGGKATTAASNLRQLGVSVRSFTTDPAYRKKTLTRLTQTPMVSGLAKVGGNLQRFTTDRAYRAQQLHRLAQAGQRITLPVTQLGRDIASLGKDAMVSVVQKSKEAMAWANQKFEQAKNSKVGQSIQNSWKWMKSTEGKATLAKFGAAIATGVAVVAVVGTGGAALPLVLAAAGVASGVAGSLAENAVLRKSGEKKYAGRKLTHGITPTTMLVDGALGIALGPAARIVGGAANRLVGSAVRYAGGGLKVAGKYAGAGLQNLRTGAMRRLGSMQSTSYRTMQQVQQESSHIWQATRQGVQTYNRGISAQVRAGIRGDMLGNAGWRGMAQRDAATLLAGTDILKKAVNQVARARVKAQLSGPMGKVLARQRLGMPGASTRRLRTALFNELKTNSPDELMAAAWKANAQLRRAAHKETFKNMGRQLRQAAFGSATTWSGKALNLATMGPRLVAGTIGQKVGHHYGAFATGGLAGGAGALAGSASEELVKFAGLKFSQNVKTNTQNNPEAVMPGAAKATLEEFGKSSTYRDAALQGIVGVSPELLGKEGMLPGAAGYDLMFKQAGAILGNNLGGDSHEVANASLEEEK